MKDLLYNTLGNKPAAMDMEIPNYLTQDEIARLIGSSRQTVTTLLTELKDEGVLEYSRKSIKYLNISKNFSGN